MPQAFALRAEYEGDVEYTDDSGGTQKRPRFVGATVHLTDGHTFDVGEALAEHKGVIVTEDAGLVNRLEQVEALKRTAVPDSYELVVPYHLMPTAALREQPAARLIGGHASMSKDELIARMLVVDAGGDGNAPLPEKVTAEQAEATAREHQRAARRAGREGAQGAARTPAQVTEESEKA